MIVRKLTFAAICLMLSVTIGAGNSLSATVCEDPRPQVCTMDYTPVCATLKDGSTKTYSNGCGACADASVESWMSDACPE